MKNKIILIVAFVALLFGCQEDEYDAPNSFSDVGFYTGAGQLSELQLNIFDYLTFSDLSQGYEEHSWEIGKGNNFLKGPISSRDSILTQYIIYDGDTITKDKTVHVLFNKSGMQKVRLRNLFKDSVTFRGYNKAKALSYTKPAIKEGNYWVIDTTFVVKVYDTIIPEIEVRQLDAVVDYTSTDTIYVEAGDKVQFIDKTTIGEPTGRYWSIRKTLPAGAVSSPNDVVASSTLEIADIVFKKLGNFTASITVNRTGQNLPSDSEKYVLKSPFKVIPSSQPFIIFGEIKELEDETIQIPFNGEFAPFLDKKEFFKVSVNGIDFPISSVSINADDATILDIVLVDKIYRPDVITISLLEGSGLESTDTRTPVTFSDEPVIMHNVNLIAANIAGMENGFGWTPWNATDGTPERSDKKAATGNYSLKMTIAPGMAWSAAQAIMPEALILDGTKKYILQYKMYIDESTTKRPAEGGMFLITNWGWQFWIDYRDTTQYPTGEWVTRTIDYQSGQALTKFYLRFSGDGGSSNATVYFDDFYFVEKEVRP